MPGTKRASTGGESASKKAKVDNGETAGKKRAAKTSITPTQFKASALPLHFSITHTPPSTETEESESTRKKDEGWLGHVAALPTTFSTGTLGWKGSKRLTVELEVGEGDKKETVQVMLNINATVLGSKPSKKDKDNGAASKGEDEDEGAASKGEDEGSSAALKEAAGEAVDEHGDED